MRTSVKMYNSEVELVFDDLAHKYIVDGKIVPGSTTCLGILNKPSLPFWAANCAADYVKDNLTPGVSLDEMEIDDIWKGAKKAHLSVKDRAASVGTKVHSYIEEYIKGNNPELSLNPEMRNCEELFLKWVEKFKVKFLLSEEMVYSRKNNYCGTLDFVCIIDGNLWIGDIKTSNAIYEEYISQVASYKNARIEEFPNEKYMGAVILRIGKTDLDFQVVMKMDYELEPYFNLFLAAKEAYLCDQIIKNLK